MSEIEYFYTAHSAYAYLGSARFMEIAAGAGRRIVHKPMDLVRVMEGFGSTPFKSRSLRYRNYHFYRELERWAEYRGVKTLGRHPRYHQHSPDLANRVLIAAGMAGHAIDRLAHGMLEAHWAADADLADRATLLGIIEKTGLDGEFLLEEAQSGEVSAQYENNTGEAIERRVPGSPTYCVDGDLFFGQDRLELVERALKQPFANTWPSLQV